MRIKAVTPPCSRLKLPSCSKVQPRIRMTNATHWYGDSFLEKNCCMSNPEKMTRLKESTHGVSTHAHQPHHIVTITHLLMRTRYVGTDNRRRLMNISTFETQ